MLTNENRDYTSWIATKVEVNDVQVNTIKPVDAKKNITLNELEALMKSTLKIGIPMIRLKIKRFNNKKPGLSRKHCYKLQLPRNYKGY